MNAVRNIQIPPTPLIKGGKCSSTPLNKRGRGNRSRLAPLGERPREARERGLFPFLPKNTAKEVDYELPLLVVKPFRAVSSEKNRGFTLLEVLIASVMFAVAIGALYSLLHGALRMRETSHARFEEQLPKTYAMNTMKRDIAGTVTPTGLLWGAMTGTKNEEVDVREDTLEFCTDTGIVSDDKPWGEVQKIKYYLEVPEEQGESDESESKTLVREITRNLLATTEEEPETQTLLQNVESLTFTYYDGQEWQDAWDSTTQDNASPEAVKAWIEFLPFEEDGRTRSPIEFVVPTVMKSSEEEASDAG